MSWLRDFFKPPQDEFTRLLIEQAAWVVKGLDALNAYVTAGNVKAGDAKDAKAGDVKAGDARDAKGEAKAAELKAGEARAAELKVASAKAAEDVRICEEAADEVRRILINELNRTFATPMDREDISALSR